MDLMI
jgi:hypothetical protein